MLHFVLSSMAHCINELANQLLAVVSYTRVLSSPTASGNPNLSVSSRFVWDYMRLCIFNIEKCVIEPRPRSKFTGFVPIKLSRVAGWSVYPWHAPWRRDCYPVLFTSHSVASLTRHYQTRGQQRNGFIANGILNHVHVASTVFSMKRMSCSER